MNNLKLNKQINTEYLKAPEVAKWLLARGKTSITTDELAALLGVPKTHVSQRMAPLRHRKEIVSPSRGLWLPIPSEYMVWGAPPAIDIVDALMKHLKTNYYIGWLSAAEIHGASHHAPQVFQVATERSVRPKTIGRSRFQFFHRENIKLISLTEIESKNAMIPVSSRETTMLDIANDIVIVGGVNNAANLVIELCEGAKPDIDAILKISKHYPATSVRRLGFLMDTFTDMRGLEKMVEICAKRNSTISILDPQAKPIGKLNTRWNIKINREVSPDV